MGANSYLNRPATPANSPAQVAKADTPTYDSGPMKRQGWEDIDTKSQEPGETIMMKGGRSGYATVKATLERPDASSWLFHVQGHIEPNSAIKQARTIAMNEKSARRPDGFQVQITPTGGGMDILVRYNGR